MATGLFGQVLMRQTVVLFIDARARKDLKPLKTKQSKKNTDIKSEFYFILDSR